MTRDDQIRFLQDTSLLAEAPGYVIRQVHTRMCEVTLREGESLFREDDPGDAAYVVLEGELRLEKEGIGLVDRGPGDCVGEFALIDDSPRSATVVALTDVVLLRWERTSFQAAVSETPGVATGIFKILLAKLREDIGIQVEAAKELIQANERLTRENRTLRVQVAPDPEVITRSPRMGEVLRLASRVAQTASTVMLKGESGTGKEVIARVIHRRGPRSEGPFIPVHCAALPTNLLESELFGHEKGSFTGATARRQGRFELADSGTLFLDEVGEIEPETQVKLLRVLQDRQFERVGGSQTLKVDARVISASNRDLEAAVAAGRFREDLYYRLNVIPIVLPPLRTRREDIPLLVEHFMGEYCREMGRAELQIAPEAMKLLRSYRWPGNVRELQNLVERMVVVVDGDMVEPGHLPPEMVGGGEGDAATESGESQGELATLEEMERKHVEAALARSGWNQSRAARLLGISRDQLRNRIKRYGIEGDWRVGSPGRN
ncbi:MAG: sigma 54-interacting transcriptional regulator [Candidatus Latescibacteria bacterium]|nr:sigma 54-interacting transcriptional regulator [Candidatus Latescibacterota bacterium]